MRARPSPSTSSRTRAAGARAARGGALVADGAAMGENSSTMFQLRPPSSASASRGSPISAASALLARRKSSTALW